MSDGAASAARPAAFKMPIQGGMLEALGINMYTTYNTYVICGFAALGKFQNLRISYHGLATVHLGLLVKLGC